MSDWKLLAYCSSRRTCAHYFYIMKKYVDIPAPNPWILDFGASTLHEKNEAKNLPITLICRIFYLREKKINYIYFFLPTLQSLYSPSTCSLISNTFLVLFPSSMCLSRSYSRLPCRTHIITRFGNLWSSILCIYSCHDNCCLYSTLKLFAIFLPFLIYILFPWHMNDDITK